MTRASLKLLGEHRANAAVPKARIVLWNEIMTGVQCDPCVPNFAHGVG